MRFINSSLNHVMWNMRPTIQYKEVAKVIRSGNDHFPEKVFCISLLCVGGAMGRT